MLGKTEDTYKKLDRISVLFLITANIDAGPDFTNVLLDYRGDWLYHFRCAGVAELADALDSKSSGPKGSCRFDPDLRHHFNTYIYTFIYKYICKLFVMGTLYPQFPYIN